MGHARECQLLIGLETLPFHLYSKRNPSPKAMYHSSDSDGSDHDETCECDKFNTLPDELVLKIIKMAFDNLKEEKNEGNMRLKAPKFNFLVKVVSNISTRYVTMLFH